MICLQFLLARPPLAKRLIGQASSVAFTTLVTRGSRRRQDQGTSTAFSTARWTKNVREADLGGA